MLCFRTSLFRLGKTEAWGAGKKRNPIRRVPKKKKWPWKGEGEYPVWRKDSVSGGRPWRSESCMGTNAWGCAGTLASHA